MRTFLSTTALTLAMATAGVTTATADKTAEFESKVEQSMERVHAAHSPADPSNLDYYELYRRLRSHYKKEMPSLFDSPTWPEFIANRTVERLPKYLALKKQKELQQRKIEDARKSKSRLRFNKNLKGGKSGIHKAGSLHKVGPLGKPRLSVGGNLGARH